MRRILATASLRAASGPAGSIDRAARTAGAGLGRAATLCAACLFGRAAEAPGRIDAPVERPAAGVPADRGRCAALRRTALAGDAGACAAHVTAKLARAAHPLARVGPAAGLAGVAAVGVARLVGRAAARRSGWRLTRHLPWFAQRSCSESARIFLREVHRAQHRQARREGARRPQDWASSVSRSASGRVWI